MANAFAWEGISRAAPSIDEQLIGVRRLHWSRLPHEAVRRLARLDAFMVYKVSIV
jgi:hypothetical protein